MSYRVPWAEVRDIVMPMAAKVARASTSKDEWRRTLEETHGFKLVEGNIGGMDTFSMLEFESEATYILFLLKYAR